MGSMYGWLIFGIVAAVAISVVYGILFSGYTFFKPLTRHMEQRSVEPVSKAFTIGYRPCCPPGLGHNEQGSPTKCRRRIAQEVATPEQLIRLDAAWSEYNREPSQVSLDTWEQLRDDVIETAFMGIENADERKELLMNNPTRVIEAPSNVRHREPLETCRCTACTATRESRQRLAAARSDTRPYEDGF